jgi:hypothetical protein
MLKLKQLKLGKTSINLVRLGSLKLIALGLQLVRLLVSKKEVQAKLARQLHISKSVQVS